MPNPILSAFGITPPKASLSPSQMILTPVATRTERKWREYLGNQGGVSKAKPTVSDRVEGGLADSLGAMFGGKYGRHVAKRTTAALNDATPLGNITGVGDGQRMFAGGVKRGDLLAGGLGLGMIALNVLPGAGAMKSRAGRKLADILGHEGGAIRAWHGSPHDFDRFDMSKIGTGEGAQGYGHGLYFTDSRRLANNYRNAQMIPNMPSGFGHLYDVNINADLPEFLPLDDAIRSHPPALNILNTTDPVTLARGRGRTTVMLDRARNGAEEAHNPATIQQLHNAFTNYGADPQANRLFSDMFAAKGYKGFVYGQPKDALGGGGRNYVVFDDKLVDIIGKH